MLDGLYTDLEFKLYQKSRSMASGKGLEQIAINADQEFINIDNLAYPLSVWALGPLTDNMPPPAGAAGQ